MATGPVEQRNQDATCYVGNLDEQLSEELLWEMMRGAGADAPNRRSSRRRRRDPASEYPQGTRGGGAIPPRTLLEAPAAAPRSGLGISTWHPLPRSGSPRRAGAEERGRARAAAPSRDTLVVRAQAPGGPDRQRAHAARQGHGHAPGLRLRRVPSGDRAETLPIGFLCKRTAPACVSHARTPDED